MPRNHQCRRAVLSDIKQLLVLLAYALTVLALACSDKAESTNAAPPAEQTRAAGAPTLPTPPATTASSGGVTVPMGVGSSCWPTPGGTGGCVDKVGPITATQPLVVARGARVDVANAVPGAQIREASVSAFQPSGQPQQTGKEFAWSFPMTDGTTIPSSVDAVGVHFNADLPPGRYVVSVFLIVPQGDVSYGLLLEVQ